MQHINRWMVVIVLILAALNVAACAETKAANAPSKIQPAQVEKIEGSELNRLTLTEKAAQRLNLQTTPAREEQVDGAQRLVIPYSAVIYDLHGETWAYTSAEPLSFVRESITVDYIENDLAYLKEGPASGTEVVTVGVAELYGADTGIGK